MEWIFIGLIIILIIMIILSVWLLNPNAAKKTTEIEEEFIGTFPNEVPTNIEIQNQRNLNCYDYMSGNKDYKSWIDNGVSEAANNKRKVLTTLRTSTHYLDNTNTSGAVTMAGCYIPHEIGQKLYNIDGNCTIRDVRNNRQVQLEPGPQGCEIPFLHPKFNSASKFNNVLDIAFQAYEKENYDIIDDLKRQIAQLKAEIALYKSLRDKFNADADAYDNATRILIAPNNKCMVENDFIQNMEAKKTQFQAEVSNYQASLNQYQNMALEVDNLSDALDNEYGVYYKYAVDR